MIRMIIQYNVFCPQTGKGEVSYRKCFDSYSEARHFLDNYVEKLNLGIIEESVIFDRAYIEYERIYPGGRYSDRRVMK